MKYFSYRDKSRTGEKELEIPFDRISEWDLQEEDWNDRTLGDFINDAYIGDVWETRLERIECTKIID